jgi:hypothetical protein
VQKKYPVSDPDTIINLFSKQAGNRSIMLAKNEVQLSFSYY